MTRALERLSALLTQLPGIGRKTAQRISFYLLKMKLDDVETLAGTIVEVRQKLRFCRICFNLAEWEPEERARDEGRGAGTPDSSLLTPAPICSICADPSRDQHQLCVVESPADILALERSHIYHGLYHVLGGALSPLDNVGPDDLRIRELEARVQGLAPVEIIVATNPTTEGEATATYLARVLGPRPGLTVTRIARGLPIGSDLDLADEVTLARALEGRKEI